MHQSLIRSCCKLLDVYRQEQDNVRVFKDPGVSTQVEFIAATILHVMKLVFFFFFFFFFFCQYIFYKDGQIANSS